MFQVKNLEGVLFCINPNHVMRAKDRGKGTTCIIWFVDGSTLIVKMSFPELFAKLSQ
jgi:hypothetical protein